MSMPTPANSESSISLRKIIEHKRKHGKISEALTLAKLGRRVVLQADRALGVDEASRKALELYLELAPDDEYVRLALQNLSTQTFPIQTFPTQSNTPKHTSRLFVWIGSFSVIGLCLVSALFFYSSHFILKTNSKPIQPAISSNQTATATHVNKILPSISSVSSASSVALVKSISTEPIVIRAVGDVVLGSNYPQVKLPDDVTKKRIEALHHTLNNADVVVGNLEGVLYDKGKSTKDISHAGYFTFRMPENYASTLHAMGFDVLSLANNHSMDFGVEGMESTKTALRAEGIQPVGVPGAEIATLDIRDTKIAFLSYSYLANFTPMNNEEQIKLDIENAKQLATLVIVTVHAGGEGEAAGGTPENDEYFMNEYRGNIRKFSQFAIDSGASAVFGHGPHVIRPYEIYRGKPIFFSLGNFIGYRSFSTKGTLGNSIVAEVRFSSQGQFLGAGIIPLKMDEWGIPSADYSLATLNTLDGLLDKQLEKRPVLELSPRVQPNVDKKISTENVQLPTAEAVHANPIYQRN